MLQMLLGGALLLPAGLAGPAAAQSVGCVETPVGPPVTVQGWASRSQRNRQENATTGQTRDFRREAGGAIVMGNVPMYGTVCGTTPPLPADPLHGLPMPASPGQPSGGLLRNVPAADVLHGP